MSAGISVWAKKKKKVQCIADYYKITYKYLHTI